MSEARVSVRLEDVYVYIDCPHDSVDDETIRQVVADLLRQNARVDIKPRWNADGSGPVFRCEMEPPLADQDEWEIEDDNRADAPGEFSAELQWCKDTGLTARTQPCVHPPSAIESSGEGTHHCGACAEQAASQDGEENDD
jgi:hypothetical protein